MLYDEGYGVPRDHVESCKWFLLAVRGGHRGAQGHVDILVEEFLSDENLAEATRRADAWRAVKE